MWARLHTRAALHLYEMARWMDQEKIEYLDGVWE
jgi:hypothetical protein